MMRLVNVKKKLIRVGKVFSLKVDKLVNFYYYNKEVLDNGSTKEKSIKGKKR